MNVSKILSKLAALQYHQSAIIFNDQEFTYGELNDIANSLAGYLVDIGIGKKDTVAVILPNCPEFAFIYFAAAKIGAIFTPIDLKLGENEINSILDDTRAKVCFVYPGLKHLGRLRPQVLEFNIAGEKFKSIVQTPLAVSFNSTRGSSTDTNSRYSLLSRRRVGVAGTNKINGRFRVSDTSKIYNRSGVPHTLVHYHGGF